MEDDLNRRLDAALQAKWMSRQILLRKILRETSPPETGTPGTHPRPDRGFTPEQFAIILVLQSYGHGITVKEIAEAIEVPHSNITRTLDRLEKKGLVRRRKGDKDKRQMIVRLTLEGNKAAVRLKTVDKRLHELLWRGYSNADKEHLVEMLERIPD